MKVAAAFLLATTPNNRLKITAALIMHYHTQPIRDSMSCYSYQTSIGASFHFPTPSDPLCK